LTVTKAELGKDEKTIKLTIPEIKPTWVIEIQYQVNDKEGMNIDG
jgi:hypothetical protein